MDEIGMTLLYEFVEPSPIPRRECESHQSEIVKKRESGDLNHRQAVQGKGKTRIGCILITPIKGYDDHFMASGMKGESQAFRVE